MKLLGRSGAEQRGQLGIESRLVVVSAVSAAPINPYDGQAIILRTTNHRELLIWNAVLGRWVGEERETQRLPMVYNYGLATNVAGNWYYSASGAVNSTAITAKFEAWRERANAGLRPQFRAEGMVGDPEVTGQIDFQLGYVSMTAPGRFTQQNTATSLPAVGFGPVNTILGGQGGDPPGSFYAGADIAWTDIPAGYTLRDYIRGEIFARSPSAQGYLFGGAVLIRWTS